jgi:hypothetical protein
MLQKDRLKKHKLEHSERGARTGVGSDGVYPKFNREIQPIGRVAA